MAGALLVLVLISSFLFVKEIPAQVYKYVGKDGVTHFTDTPNDPKYKSYMSKDSELQTSSGFRGCEIVSFSQYEFIKETCVNLSIRNNDRVERSLRDENIMAIARNGEKKKGGGMMATIGSKKTYEGIVCFDRHLDVIERVDLVDESEKENLRKAPPPQPRSENKSYGGVNTIGSSRKSVIRKDRSGKF